MSYSFSELDFLKPELGAEFIGEGTHFALFSAHAEAVELCLFSPDGKEETQRLALPKREGDIWSGYVAGLQPGTVYGYRVHGPYDPQNGHRFNPNKLLLDPYAKQIVGDLSWDDSLYGYKIGAEEGDLSFDERDSAAFMPKGVVQNPDFDWNGDEAIRRPWTDTIVYEAHVRGLTMQHPDVPDELRGSFLGMCSEPILDHLSKLGVSAIELLPVQYFLDDRYLVEKGLRNFWGYQSLGFFAPQSRYLSGNQIAEFKTMVKAFHSVGIEVIMDVVYNHTAEGSERGPTLSFRGIDNLSYYIQSPDELRHTFDTTGTGNTLNVAHPMVMRMVLDSLRYWVGVMHVDGFRFDLASTLGREDLRFDREGGFFDAIRQDPILAGVKLIAEPWDVGMDGYQVGGFPFPFREWNDKFRDDVRRFWRKDGGLVAPLAERLTGSPVQFDHSGRSATTSVNLLSAHDGFVLADVTSFNDKHNEANGEQNHDGHDGNESDNMGIEGETDDETVLTARDRRRRAMVATLFVSQGVPMLLGGDELGNTQHGNNNSYCQDNKIGWISWDGREDPFLDFCRAAIAFRKSQPLLRQERFLKGEPGDPPAPYVSWLKPDGSGMDDVAWGDSEMRIVMMHLKDAPGEDGAAEELLLLLNAGDATPVRLPEGGEWQFAFSSAEEMEISDAGETESPGQSVLVFSRRQ